MSYTDSVLHKLLNPGLLLLLAGAVLVYGSHKLAAAFFHAEGERLEKLSLIVKIIGTVLAMAGAVLVFLTN